MHKFEKRDAKSRTLVILAVVGLAAALTVGIFTAVRMLRKPPASKDDPKTGIVYDDSAIEGGWDNLSPEEIAEKLNEKVAEGMINISMNTAPYFENGAADGNLMIVNESINKYPQQVELDVYKRQVLAEMLIMPSATFSFSFSAISSGERLSQPPSIAESS